MYCPIGLSLTDVRRLLTSLKCITLLDALQYAQTPGHGRECTQGANISNTVSPMDAGLTTNRVLDGPFRYASLRAIYFVGPRTTANLMGFATDTYTGIYRHSASRRGQTFTSAVVDESPDAP